MKKVLCIIVALVLTMAVAFALVGCKKKSSGVSEFDKQFQGNYKEATVEQAQAYLDKIEQMDEKTNAQSSSKRHAQCSEVVSSSEAYSNYTYEITMETSGSINENTFLTHGTYSCSGSESWNGETYSESVMEETWANYAEDIFYTKLTKKETENGQTESSTKKYSGAISDWYHSYDSSLLMSEPGVLPGIILSRATDILYEFVAGGEVHYEYKVYFDGNKCKIETFRIYDDGVEEREEVYLIVEDNKIVAKATVTAAGGEDNEKFEQNITLTFELCPQAVTMPNPAEYPAKQDELA